MTPIELADRLFGAIERGDVDGVAACYSADAVIWHNYDGVAQAAADNIAVLRWLITHVRDIRYEVVRRVAIDDGFVQQHILHGTTASGAPLRVPACMVVRVGNGRIERIDEYLDTAQLAPLLTAPA